MKREIKFRCFDKQYKTMHNVNMILFSTNELDHDGNNGEPKSIDHFELMQFTGLHDKNGNEIYEGDIMQFPDGRIASVIWHSYMWAIQSDPFSKTEKRFCNMDKDDGVSKIVHHADRYSNLKRGEVIGNIHQNPELLQP